MKAMCPVCDASVGITDDVQVSEVIACLECKTKLEVTSKAAENVELKEAPKVEEDWGE